MTLQPGSQLGPYEIPSAIGAGGMGEVYKARDTRLNRMVAIKVLPAHLADRAELRDRFKREAETIASLNHPHICILHDIGKQDGIDFLVMEYLEGETLAQRLLKGPLPLEQVLQYSMEISDALDKAHRKGVTHRDLKPGNIMLTPQGGTKLLDFGLAKLKQDAVRQSPLDSQAPTPPHGVHPTIEGTILGTLQYMAPEQVEGKTDEIDGRTDIFAFGAVIYEMVTGKKTFEGKTQASLISSILKDSPPPISALQPMSPPSLDRVVKRCLAKDPEDRWQSARDLHQELKFITEGGSEVAKGTAAGTRPAATGWRRATALSVAALVLIAVGAVATWLLKPTAQPTVSRLAITLPPGQRLAALDQPAIAISPDGKNIVYVAVQGNPSRDRQGAVTSSGEPPLPAGRGSDSATQQLFLRPLDSQEAKPIAGTEGAAGPFFSPNGQWIGFFAGGKLEKVSVNGGSAVTLASAQNPGGASWSSQGTLAWQATATSLGLRRRHAAAADPAGKRGNHSPLAGVPAGRPGGAFFELGLVHCLEQRADCRRAHWNGRAKEPGTRRNPTPILADRAFALCAIRKPDGGAVRYSAAGAGGGRCSRA